MLRALLFGSKPGILSFWGKIFKTEMTFLRQFVNIGKARFHFKLHHWTINPLFSSADQRRVVEEREESG